jgi:asparagine synthase (glutamine-hydrolysing)
MVGLAGIVTTQNKHIDVEKLLPGMCNSIKHREGQKIELHFNNGIGLGRVHLGKFNPEPQPIFNEDKTKCIMMDGEIYDYQNIKNQLIIKGHKFSEDNEPELILHLYEEYGNNFVNKLNGCFSLVIWDEKLQTLLIANDRYGLRPVYYTDQNGYLLFGSEVKALLQDKTFKRTVDDRSVSEFFFFGYILGNKTFFKGIELLPPGSLMMYARGQVRVERYWDFNFNPEDEYHTEEYYIEILSELISKAVKRRMKGNHRIGVPLSGGLDSRTIVASIDKEHYPIHTFTYGKQKCNDMRFAQMIANKLGTTHHYFEFKPEDIAPYIEEVVYTTDGMMNIINLPRMQTNEEITEFMDVMLHGWIGDSLIGSRNLIKDIPDDADNFQVFRDYAEIKLPIDFFKDLFNDSYFPLFEENLSSSKEYILKMGEKVKSMSNRSLFFNLKERQHRLIKGGFVFIRNFVEFRNPFSDYDYVDFCLKIPPKFKLNNKQLYRKMVLTMFPHLRDVPYQKTGLPLYMSKFQIRLMLSPRTIFNKITENIFRFRLFFNDVELADFDKWMRENKKLKEYIKNILLDQRTLKRPYFNEKYIKHIFDSHMSGKKDYSKLIGLLITFELWNRQFMDK